MTMLHAPGETPGHSIVRVDSAGEWFYALGDLFHHASEVGASRLGVAVGRSPDACAPRASASSRRGCRAGRLVNFTHERFPMWGRIVATDDGYRWERE